MSTTSRTGSMSSSSLLSVYPHLTHRDRQLLHLLDHHQVFTTDQIHRLFFSAERTCQLRLLRLRRLELVERFRFSRPEGGSFPWYWTLGLLGARLEAAAHKQPAPTARAHRQQLERLSANPRLLRLRDTNELFVRLAHHARDHPGAVLRRWWPEHRTTQEFQTIAPDGHGLWSHGQTTVGFFVECDRGTEPHHRVAAKLGGYKRLVTNDGPRYPILLWLTNPDREQRLHHTLAGQVGALTVATTTIDRDPAEPVWWPVGGHDRVHLHELPSHHGRASAANPNFRDGHLLLEEMFIDQPAT
jgi:hypothetical protein